MICKIFRGKVLFFLHLKEFTHPGIIKNTLPQANGVSALFFAASGGELIPKKLKW
jgi:hypothetical protein